MIPKTYFKILLDFLLTRSRSRTKKLAAGSAFVDLGNILGGDGDRSRSCFLLHMPPTLYVIIYIAT